MNTQSHDLLAKLLATENITVTRQSVPTAAFDIKNRVLLLPRWKKLTTEVEEMLILHEVGHALYTTVAGYGIVQTEKKHLSEYANVIEDVRIEKKMKDRYPGSRKSFNIGYKQLNDRDFFGVKDKNLDDLLLIDRINLFYKAGYDCGVKFTDEERVFVDRADRCVTESDVIKLAQDIYDFSKQKKQEKLEQSSGDEQKVNWPKLDSEDSDDEDDYSYDSDSDFEDGDYEDGDSGQSDDTNSYEKYDPDLQPETNRKFENALSNHQDLDSETFYVQPKFEYSAKDPFVPYTKVLDEMSMQNYSVEYMAAIKEAAYRFKAESNNIVNYLVKEFEMRKSASAYKRSKVAKLGQIDVRKLYAYRLKDDIFKQITTVQEGKNHGMVFLLDWSGSMSEYMTETVQQVINLAMFCQKIRIPYQVLAFTDGYDNRSYEDRPMTVDAEDGFGSTTQFNLLELFNHKMNNVQFNKMIELLLNGPWQRVRNYRLNGTPLNHALLYMADHLDVFIKKNNVEKMNLIVLTDGESHPITKYSGDPIKNGRRYIKDSSGNLNIKDCTTVLRDPITKKEYKFSDNSDYQTIALMQLIKDRFNLRITGFYITANTYKVVYRFVTHNMNPKYNDRYSIVADIQSKLRKEKAVVLKNVPARDEMYVILSTNKIEDYDIDSVSRDMSASQISRQLFKMFNTRKSSRVVLNSFINVVA